MEENFPDNFPSWWAEYTNNKEGQAWEIGGTIWLACFAAWNYSREILKEDRK